MIMHSICIMSSILMTVVLDTDTAPNRKALSRKRLGENVDAAVELVLLDGQRRDQADDLGAGGNHE